MKIKEIRAFEIAAEARLQTKPRTPSRAETSSYEPSHGTLSPFSQWRGARFDGPLETAGRAGYS